MKRCIRNLLSFFAVCASFVGVVAIGGCGQPVPEAQMVFYDESYREQMVIALEKHDISYRTDGNTLYYAPSDRKKISEISGQLSQNLPQEFTVSSLELAESFVEELAEVGIEASLRNEGESVYVVSMSNKNAASASEIFSALLRKESGYK